MSDTPQAEDSVVVWRGWGETEASLVESLLRGEGIECWMKGEGAGIFHGFTVDGMAEIQILVARHDVEQALEILADRPEGAGPDAGAPEGAGPADAEP
jgi:hypothetical protein